MNCAFDVQGSIIPSRRIAYISQRGSGSTLHYSNGGAEDIPDDFGALIAAKGAGFLTFNAQGAKAANYLHIERVARNSAGTATVLMSTGQRFECSDTYASLLAKAAACFASGGGGSGDTVTGLIYNGSEVTLTTDLLSFSFDLGPGDIINPSALGGQAPGANLLAGVLGLQGQVNLIDVVESPAGTFTFTGPDGGQTSFNGAAPTSQPVQSDGVTIEGDGTVGDELKLSNQGADSDFDILVFDTGDARFKAKTLEVSEGMSISASAASLVISGGRQDEEILSSGGIIVKASFEGLPPTATLSGANNGQVTIVSPAGGKLINFQVSGEDTHLLGDGTKVIRIEGTPGNTSAADLNIPAVQKTLGLADNFNGPAPNAPYSIDIDNSPALAVIGVGTAMAPMIEIRVSGLSSHAKHYLKFTI